MARRKIRPEVLRPFILAVVLVAALFVLQFWRVTPPDIRQQQLLSTHEANLRFLYNGVLQYQQQYGMLPDNWTRLTQVNFAFDTIRLPEQTPDHPTVVQTPEDVQVQNMPFQLLLHGPVDIRRTPQPLILFPGNQEIGSGFVYTDGTIRWGKLPQR